MFAEHAERTLVAVPLHQHLCMAKHRVAHCAKRWELGKRLTVERSCECTEQPRPSEATSTNDDAVATSLAHHGKCVGRLPDITVAKHRDRSHCLFEFTNRIPSGMP